jgi:predicted nucleotide-binding protein
MATINQALIKRLQEHLGVRPNAVYTRIRKTGRERRVARRDLAALLLAWELGLNIHKYATAEQLDRLDRVTGGGNGPTQSPAPTSAARAPNRKGKRNRARKTKGNSVFVVHGRDQALRKSMFEFLRALGLNPMEWEQAVHQARGANPNVQNIIETAMARVQAVVVLFSPDEIAYLKEHFWGPDDRHGDGKPDGQARPNVLFEAGLALGAHPEKTVIVQVGKVRPFSDIAGKHLVKLTNDTGKRNDLANRLAKIGCDVNKVGNDWMTAGTFEPTEPKARKKTTRGKRR